MGAEHGGQNGGWCVKVRPHSSSLGWPTLVTCCILEQVQSFDKALDGLGPHYLSEHLFLTSSSQPTRFSQAMILRVVTPREANKSSTRNKAFFAVDPML